MFVRTVRDFLRFCEQLHEQFVTFPDFANMFANSFQRGGRVYVLIFAKKNCYLDLVIQNVQECCICYSFSSSCSCPPAAPVLLLFSSPELGIFTIYLLVRGASLLGLAYFFEDAYFNSP